MVPPIGRNPAQHRRQPQPCRQQRRHDTQRQSAAMLGKIVEHQTGAGRLPRRFADPHTEARHREQGKTAGKPSQPGCHRPQRDADRQQPPASPAIGQPPQWQRKHRVKQREHGAVQQAHFGIADMQVGLDPRIEDRQDIAIEHRQALHQRDQRQADPGVARQAVARCHSLNQCSALVWKNCFFAGPSISIASIARTSSATY